MTARPLVTYLSPNMGKTRYWLLRQVIKLPGAGLRPFIEHAKDPQDHGRHGYMQEGLGWSYEFLRGRTFVEPSIPKDYSSIFYDIPKYMALGRPLRGGADGGVDYAYRIGSQVTLCQSKYQHGKGALRAALTGLRDTDHTGPCLVLTAAPPSPRTLQQVCAEVTLPALTVLDVDMIAAEWDELCARSVPARKSLAKYKKTGVGYTRETLEHYCNIAGIVAAGRFDRELGELLYDFWYGPAKSTVPKYVQR